MELLAFIQMISWCLCHKPHDDVMQRIIWSLFAYMINHIRVHRSLNDLNGAFNLSDFFCITKSCLEFKGWMALKISENDTSLLSFFLLTRWAFAGSCKLRCPSRFHEVCRFILECSLPIKYLPKEHHLTL